MWSSACARTRSPSAISGRLISLSRRRSRTAFISCPRSLNSVLNSMLPELSAALAAKKISSAELTRQCLERVRSLDPELNAFITVDEEQALSAARRADDQLRKGEGGPLTGIPVALKDIYCTRGLRTTCGSRMLENYTSPYDAHVVQELDRAGMPLLGKCNMDEFAMGSSNESSYFGPVRNPWDTRRGPRRASPRG